LQYQELAERILRAQVQTVGEKHPFSNAAAVILHPETGAILAMVGSVDFLAVGVYAAGPIWHDVMAGGGPIPPFATKA